MPSRLCLVAVSCLLLHTQTGSTRKRRFHVVKQRDRARQVKLKCLNKLRTCRNKIETDFHTKRRSQYISNMTLALGDENDASNIGRSP